MSVKGTINAKSKLYKFLREETNNKKKETRLKVGILTNKDHLGSKEDKYATENISFRELARLLNQGTKNIPARPFNNMALEKAKNDIPKFLSNINFLEYRRKLPILLENLVSDYKQNLISKNYVSNAPSTIELKGFNHPLFYKGQLLKAIEGQLNQNKKIGWGREI